MHIFCNSSIHSDGSAEAVDHVANRITVDIELKLTKVACRRVIRLDRIIAVRRQFNHELCCGIICALEIKLRISIPNVGCNPSKILCCNVAAGFIFQQICNAAIECADLFLCGEAEIVNANQITRRRRIFACAGHGHKVFALSQLNIIRLCNIACYRSRYISVNIL